MRCTLCFKEKPNLVPPIPKFPAVVCKGCFYDIDRIIGYLMHYGCSILTQGQMPFKPPKPPKKEPKAPKSKSEGLGDEGRAALLK